MRKTALLAVIRPASGAKKSLASGAEIDIQNGGAVIGETGETKVSPGFQELSCHFQKCKANVCETNGSKVTCDLVLPRFYP